MFFLGELIEQHLVAQATGRVARALFLTAQDGKVDVGGLEDAHQGLLDLLGVVVGAAGAADPEQVLDFALGRFGGDVGKHRHVEALGPVHALVLPNAPRISAALDVLHRVGDLRGHVALHHHQRLSNAEQGAGH